MTGYVADKEDLLKRLRRAEGQVRGIQRMVKEDSYCIDILSQVSAATKALVLIGAWAVAPLAGEWIHQASLAIRARIPLETLRDQVAQFPTYNEAYLAALDHITA